MTRLTAPSRYLVFAVASISVFMSAIDITIVATALPNIHQSLRAGISWSGWTITIYGLGIVVALPIAGRLSDRCGRRRVFLCGVATFTVASLFCGFATNIYELIIFRAIQAIGGGTLQPSAAGLVADHFSTGRARAIGFINTVTACGQVVGPVLGGLLVNYLSWRWIFFVNVPTGIVLVIVALSQISESDRRDDQKIDVWGIVLMSSSVLALIVGITTIASKGVALYSWKFLLPVLIAATLFGMFIRRSLTVDAPFIPMRLIRTRGFVVTNTVNFFQGVVTFGAVSLVPLYAEDRFHLLPLRAGTLLTVRAVGAVVVGSIAAYCLHRMSFRLPMALGFFFVGTGTLFIAFAPPFGLSPFTWLCLGMAIAGIGLGALNPAATNASVQLAPDEVAALAGLRSMFISLGIILSVSVSTAILNRSTSPGLTQSRLFEVTAGIVLVAVLPLIYWIPEQKKDW